MSNFFERLPERERARLLGVASEVVLKPGSRLLKKGDPGGDIYQVKSGQLEVVDSTTQPPVVLKVIPSGGMVGELSFLDQSVRSADVISAGGAICLRLEKRDVERILEDPKTAAAFYRALASLTAERLRSTSTQVVGEIRASTHRNAGESRGKELARSFGKKLNELEPHYRNARTNARAEARTLLEQFRHNMTELLQSVPEAEAGILGEDIRVEFEPYLIRSELGELSMQGLRNLELLRHVDQGQPKGDESIGTTIDEWLLELPSLLAMRERRALLSGLISDNLPSDPPYRILVVGLGSGSTVVAMLSDLAGVGVDLRCLDDRAEIVKRLRRELPRVGRTQVSVEEVDPWMLISGQVPRGKNLVHIVILDEIFDSLPQQLTLNLLEWAHAQLMSGGKLLCTAMNESPDDLVLRHLLGWPIVRRRVDVLTHLLEVAGFQDVDVKTDTRAGVGLIGLASKP